MSANGFILAFALIGMVYGFLTLMFWFVSP